jgi:alpha-beta hydrolase superfamily lysophospholipase/phosphatidylglycerophosphate synthase/SAM-dependent methyltransferase
MSAIAGFKIQGVYGLKPRFQELLRPISRWFAASRITANQLTITACVGSAAVGIALAANASSRPLFLILPVWLFVRMALNAMDGMLARDFQQQSHLGAYLNELGDDISDAFCYLPFAFLPEFGPFLIGGVIVLSLISEMAGTVGSIAGATRRYDGPMGKSDRALVFGALALWIGIGGPIGQTAAAMASSVLMLLLAVTIINRVSSGLAEIEARSLNGTPPALLPSRSREVREYFFVTHDGNRLYYRHWPAQNVGVRRAVVLLHRGHEHSGRLAHVAGELGLPEFDVFAWDARGHGHSAAAQQRTSPSLGIFVKDLDWFIRHLAEAHSIPVANIAIVSQSVGSVLAATWVHDYAPKLRAMVLVAPAFKVKLYIPFARRALTLIHRLIGDFHVNSYVRASALTHDAERIASYKTDPFITRPISVRVLLGLYGTSDRIVRDAQAIHVPTQILISGKDFVVRRKPQLDFFERLGAARKEKQVFEGFYHDILGEKDRHLPIEKIREFILKTFSAGPEIVPLQGADEHGETKREFDALNRALPIWSLKGVGFALVRVAIKSGGRLSNGIRLGLRAGFDSGSSLDYVYRNRASGITPVGKFIDRCYLESTGWRGIRTRKQNVIRALRRCIADLAVGRKPVRILDVAAGHGRYVLEAIEFSRQDVEDVLLRDFSKINLDCAAELAQRRDLKCVRFEPGDAFDRESVANIRPHRTLGVVSGLYELFPQNDLVRQSLAGLAEAIEAGGFLIYTGQPYHPQLEIIARTLLNREQRPWIMRRRTQAELDQLVEDAGFRKIEQWIDDEGIFSVSIARRTAE